MELKTSVQATKIPGSNSNPKQLVVRRLNWKDKKELSEVQAAGNFCKLTGRESWKVETRTQDDSVDITVRSPDAAASLDIQIVRLWEQDAWKALNVTGAVDKEFTEQEAIELFKRAFASKGANKYPAAVRQGLALLIDANPIGNVSDFLTDIKNTIGSLAGRTGYKEVWVVGTADALQLA